MANIKLKATGGPPGHDQPKCPFCKEPDLLHYRTKHGMEKDEDALGKNLQADAGTDITADCGPVYPLPGGGDPTQGWNCDPGVFTNTKGSRIDEVVFIPATPHHLIPGKAAMARSKIETWTRKGKIKEDIGYDIDGAQNGIWLPRIPEIYFTNTVQVEDTPGKMVTVRMTDHYGTKKWGALGDNEQTAIAYKVMLETELQFHHTSHGAGYIGSPNQSYDNEAREACNALADEMDLKAEPCPQNKGDGKMMPPYSLVGAINKASQDLKRRITGHPRNWKSWVTRLSQRLTIDVKSRKVKAVTKGDITLVT